MKYLLLIALPFVLSSANICEEYNAHVESVYDGDTVTLDIEVGFDMMINDAKIRIYGIDAPEMRGEERPQGIIARDALRELIDGKDVRMVYHGKGKYFRYIAEIYIDTINISHWMVRNGYAEYKDY